MASGLSVAQKNKGDVLMAEAEKAMNPKGFGSFFTSKETKFENASELYDKAGIAYKTGKCWNDAGDAYTRLSECFVAMGQQGDAAAKLKEAGDCFQKVNAHACVASWRAAAAAYLEAGRWNQAGNITKNVAELFEAALENGLADSCEDHVSEACDSYAAAAEYYEAESPPRTQAAASCQEKVAMLSAGRGEGTQRAAEIFETLGRTALESKLLKFNAKSHFVKAVVCHLAAGDTVQAGEKLSSFQAADISFEKSREEKFLTALIGALSSQNAQAFGDAAAEYNAIKKIDPWMTSLLLQCKRTIIVEEPVSLSVAADESDEEAEPAKQVASDEEDLS